MRDTVTGKFTTGPQLHLLHRDRVAQYLLPPSTRPHVPPLPTLTTPTVTTKTT